MFGALNNFFHNIKVIEQDGIITVKNLRADFIESDIKKVFASGRVTANMFSNISKYSFSFPSFFAPDFLFALRKLTEQRSLKIPVRTLSQIRDLLLQNTWLKDTIVDFPSKLDKSKLSDFVYDLFDYQNQFLDTYDVLTQKYHLNGYLLGAGVGKGKTLMSLALAHCLGADKVIVVSPKNAITKVWRHSIATLFKTPQTQWVSDSDTEFTGKERFIVVHYEYLIKLLEQLDRVKGENVVVILDESHNFSELKSMRTQHLINLCKRTNSKNIVWLSGTPIKAVSVETIPLFRCFDPLFTEDVETRFKAIFKGDTNKATAILTNRLGLVSFRTENVKDEEKPVVFSNLNITFKGSEKYTLDSISKDMKAFIEKQSAYYKERRNEDQAFYDHVLSIYEKTLTDKIDIRLFNLYKQDVATIIKHNAGFEVNKEIVSCNRYELREIMPKIDQSLRNKFKETKAIIKYTHLVIRGQVLGRIVGKARIDCHVDMVKHIDFNSICESSEAKTIVFTSFTDVVKECDRVMKEKDLNPLLVYADTNKDLAKIITKFDQDETANPLIATYASLSASVPLIMANTMIMIDTPFRDYQYSQTVGRINRVGQTRQVYVYTCILETDGKPNISTRTVDILEWSQKQMSDILGVKATYQIPGSNSDFNVSLESMNNFVYGYNEIALEEIHEFKPPYLNW